jgi:uncharacterized membrane protein
LSAGAAASAARRSRRAPAWLPQAESWLLWLGTASAWAALGLGLLAEKTAPHVPPAWEVLADHETLAWCAVAAFSGLSSLRYYAVKSGRDAGYIRAGQGLLWVLGAGLLIATAMHGAELVYGFGMGVGAP